MDMKTIDTRFRQVKAEAIGDGIQSQVNGVDTGAYRDDHRIVKLMYVRLATVAKSPFSFLLDRHRAFGERGGDIDQHLLVSSPSLNH